MILVDRFEMGRASWLFVDWMERVSHGKKWSRMHRYALGPVASKTSLDFAADLLCDDVFRPGDELFVLMHQLFEDRPFRCIVRDFLGVR